MNTKYHRYPDGFISMSTQIRTKTLMDSAKEQRRSLSAPSLTENLVDSPGGEGEGTYQLQMSVKRCGFTRRIGMYQILISLKPMVDSLVGKEEEER